MYGLFALLLGLFAVGSVSGGSETTEAAVEDTPDDGPDDAGGGSDGGGEASFLSAFDDPDTAYYAADGQLILEAENGHASGDWKSRTIEGEEAMLWDSDRNSYRNADPDQALSFEFMAEEDGTYKIALHAGRVKAAQDPGDVRDDTGNDAWVKVTNLETGEVVLEPTKLFTVLHDSDRELRWGKTFDKDHDKSDSEVTLEKDTAYRLELIGRSDGHVVDRITLSNEGFLRNTEIPESDLLLDHLNAMASDTLSLSPMEDDEEMNEPLVLL